MYELLEQAGEPQLPIHDPGPAVQASIASKPYADVILTTYLELLFPVTTDCLID